MPKQFYTERDMDELAKTGVQSLQISDQVVLTQLAYERAKQLGIQLLQDQPDNLPGAPLRPYLSKMPLNPAKPAAAPPPDVAPQPALESRATISLHDRILLAVRARLSDQQLEAEILENIIQRVLNSLGMK